MKQIHILFSAFSFLFLSSFSSIKEEYSLTIEVENLRNSKGVLQVALYNKEGSIPDEIFKKYYRLEKAKIVNGKSEITFENLPKGKYAVNILHDENNNSKIDKGLILPKEGIGFSNYSSIGLTNRPNFKKASFDLFQDKEIKVKVIYYVSQARMKAHLQAAQVQAQTKACKRAFTFPTLTKLNKKNFLPF